jgi:hypothetical protein
VLADPEKYRAAATLPPRPTVAERAEDARRRRDLAVAGYIKIHEAVQQGDFGPLHAFYEAASALVKSRSEGWEAIVRERPLSQAEYSLAVTQALTRGEHSHLSESAVYRAPMPNDERGFGMCGRLRAYDVANATPSTAVRLA